MVAAKSKLPRVRGLGESNLQIGRGPGFLDDANRLTVGHLRSQQGGGAFAFGELLRGGGLRCQGVGFAGESPHLEWSLGRSGAIDVERGMTGTAGVTTCADNHTAPDVANRVAERSTSDRRISHSLELSSSSG
jgi:hypothetical protein